MNHNGEAKVREEKKKEQFQVHALINTDREKKIVCVPDWVPVDGNFSVPHFPLLLHDSKQFSY